MSDFIRFLTDDSPVPNSADQTRYQQLGKEAAELMVEHGTDMNKTIKKMASANSFNPEQVKRVVESANNAAFSSLFKKEAGYVTFPVADVQQIVTGEKQKVKVAAEQPHPLSDVATDTVATQLFGEGCLEKVAEEEAPANIVDITQKARHAADRVEDARTDALNKLGQLQDFTQEMVTMEQAGKSDIQRALVLSGHDDNLAKLACVKVEEEDDIPIFEGEILVDGEHPLLEKAAAFVDSLNTYVAEKEKFAHLAKGFQDAIKS